MEMREFTKNDWNGWAGATAPKDGQPWICEVQNPDGDFDVLIADAEGLAVNRLNAEGEPYGVDVMEIPFPAALVVAAALPDLSPDTCRGMGFRMSNYN